MKPRFIRWRTVFLRFFFHQLYHRFAWTYDWVAATVSVGLWKSWVEATLPYLTGPRILELGFGPGHLQAALHQKGLAPVGIDASPDMAHLSFQRLCKLKIPQYLVIGYANFLPFENQAFDQAVATFPTEYIVDPATLNEIWRVLTPGGVLYILPGAWITSPRFPYRLAAWLFRVTGESPTLSENMINRLYADAVRHVGFSVTLEQIRLPESLLFLIIARK